MMRRKERREADKIADFIVTAWKIGDVYSR
jgi:hypothetical protein